MCPNRSIFGMVSLDPLARGEQMLWASFGLLRTETLTIMILTYKMHSTMLGCALELSGASDHRQPAGVTLPVSPNLSEHILCNF